METKPLTWHDLDPANSCDKGVSESETLGDIGAAIRCSPPLQDKKAPRAEPEEDIDIDMQESGALQKTQTLQSTERADATKTENQDSIVISLCTPGETQETATELEHISNKLLEESEESKMDRCDDFFPPLSALSAEECPEKDFPIEVDVAEWISDIDIISDPTDDLVSPDSQCGQEWQTDQFTEPVNGAVDSEEMIRDSVTAEETAVQLNYLPDGFTDSRPENNMSAAGTNSTAHQSLPERNDFEDVHIVRSPPYADESEEEEEVKVAFCQLQSGTLDISSNFCDSAGQDFAPFVPAVTLDKQQGELFPQSQCKLAPKGADQEAAQQVLSQGSPPLSAVAMELSNPGGLATQGSGCAVAVREGNRRAGQRTEGKSEQTGGEEGQTESGLETDNAAGQQHRRGLLKSSKSVQIQEPKEGKYKCVSFKYNRMESDSSDDSQSDSGVSADFSPCSTLESSATIPTGSPATAPKETPIEREIRRAIEREHSLRRSRGLPNPPASPEYVEIPLRKNVLCQSLTAKSDRCQGKDRQFAGKKMQHEIHEEAQREQDLVKLGKVPGFYDKGTVRQLKERKQLFEAFQKPSELISPRSNATSWSSDSDHSTLEIQEDLSSQASTVAGSHGQRSIELLSPTQNPTSDKGLASTNSTARGASFSEGTNCQVIILENNLSIPSNQLYRTKPEAITAPDSGAPFVSGGRGSGITGRVQEKEEEEEGQDLAPKENPFFKLRSSTALVKVERDIREAQERERELRKQRISLYGGTKGDRGGGGGLEGGGGGGEGRPANVEGQSNTLSSSSLNGLAVPDLPDPPQRRGTRPPAARQSVGKLGVWPPAPAGEEKISQPEVLHGPRTPRQKTPLVQRWESGLINGHNQEEN